MIETIKDMKHGKPSYDHGHHTLERTANQILHHMEDKESEDSLESTRARVLGEESPSHLPFLPYILVATYHTFSMYPSTYLPFPS
jgi:hypothetical protein